MLFCLKQLPIEINQVVFPYIIQKMPTECFYVVSLHNMNECSLNIRERVTHDHTKLSLCPKALKQ